MKGRRLGLSLLETTIAMALLSLLMTMFFQVFIMGSSGLAKGDTMSDVVRSVQRSCNEINTEVSRSIYLSLSVSPSQQGVSFLSAVNSTSLKFDYNAGSGVPRWRNYLVYYRNAATNTLQLRRVNVVGSPQESAPTAIQQFGPNQPVLFYCNGGVTMAPIVTSCRFDVPANEQTLRFFVVAQRKRYGSERLENFSLTAVSAFRN